LLKKKTKNNDANDFIAFRKKLHESITAMKKQLKGFEDGSSSYEMIE